MENQEAMLPTSLLRYVLREALPFTASGKRAKNMPILAYARLKTMRGGTGVHWFFATDGEYSLKSHLTLVDSKDIDVLLPVRALLNVLGAAGKKLHEAQIVVDQERGMGYLHLSSGFRYAWKLMNPDDMPGPGDTPDYGPIRGGVSIQGLSLETLLPLVVECASAVTATNVAFNNVLIEKIHGTGTARLVSTDGHRLAETEVRARFTGELERFLVPRGALERLLNVSRGSFGPTIDIVAHEKHVLIYDGDLQITSPRVGVPYPTPEGILAPLEKLREEGAFMRLDVPSKRLRRALKILDVATDSALVMTSLKNRKLTMASFAEDGSFMRMAVSSVSGIRHTGIELDRVSFANDMLYGILDSVSDGAVVKMYFFGETRPILIEAAEGQRVVLMTVYTGGEKALRNWKIVEQGVADAEVEAKTEGGGEPAEGAGAETSSGGT